jgi:hypothetical protein
MDSLASHTTVDDAVISSETKDSYSSAVDPFLVEVLQNPRHRLTVLRMELDIQKFLQNSDQQQFEFQHFPTSYLRLAAHRVAQHYGLQTMVLDNFLDGGQGLTKILARKTGDSIYPAVVLSDIPAKQSENDKQDRVKVVLKPRPNNGSMNGNSGLGTKRSPVRTVEERKEEYDRARARIFSTSNSPEPEDQVITQQYTLEGKSFCLAGENETLIDSDNYNIGRDAMSSRVAIFRDREKDRTDPDYDRSYDRYVRNLPIGPSFGLMPMQQQQSMIPPPYLQQQQYESVYQHGGVYRNNITPYCAMTSSSSDAGMYVQWPSNPMMYAHPYDQFRHAVFQAPFYQQQQQPLSFDYSQNN